MINSSSDRGNVTSPIQDAISVIVHKPEIESFARATHDFCDKTTWYSNSIRVESEILSTSDNLTFVSDNPFWIDIISGKVNRQDTLPEYKVEIKVNGIVVNSGFTINHREGSVTFDSATMLVIRATYSYATNSEWVLKPEEGTLLIIEHSEIQFALDVKVNNPFRFEIWVYNPYDLPNKFMFQHIQYNSIRDLVNEANLGTGTIPQIGDLPECVVFPFNYASIKPFLSSQGAELRISTINHEETTGSFGTATFYLLKRNE